MLRAFMGALVGYVVLAVVVIVTLSLAWQFLGCGFAYKEFGSFDTTTGWSLLALIMGFGAAYVGGRVAVRIGAWKAAKVLAMVIIILGFMGAISQLTRDEAQVIADRAGLDPCELTISEAASMSSAPAWYNFLNPLIGAAAVWIVGKEARRDA